MHRRRLPHVYSRDAWLFVTWHLDGSVAAGEYPLPRKQTAGEAFVWMDRRLDTARTGPMYLKKPEAAGAVVEALRHGAALQMYDLRAFVVMSNHVHVLFRPRQDARRVLQWIKGTTARECNLLLGRTGHPFWQRESYDHAVRNDEEIGKIVRYIENNPVKAGLVASPELYEWSSGYAPSAG